MKSFKDSKNREWKIELTIGSAKRVLKVLGVNLLELEKGDPPLLTQLGLDIILLCDVIYVLVQPQADREDVSDEDFGELLGGDVILRAQVALYEELVLFFQGLGRKDLATALATQKKMIDLAVTKAEMQINDLDLEKVVNTTLGKLSMSLPESAESSPTP